MLLNVRGGLLVVNSSRDSSTPRPTIELNCSADGIPAPAIRWTRNGVLIVETPSKYGITETEEPGTIRSVQDRKSV